MRKGKLDIDRFLLHLAVLLAFLYVSVNAYWLLRPYNIQEHFKTPYTVLNENKEVRAGEVVYYRVDFCKYKVYPAVIRSCLINGFIHTFETRDAELPIGCYEDAIVELHIPEGTPPGVYTYSETIEYQVNPVRTVSYTYKSEPFKIIE